MLVVGSHLAMSMYGIMSTLVMFVIMSMYGIMDTLVMLAPVISFLTSLSRLDIGASPAHHSYAARPDWMVQ